jgi:glucosyl-dolichyl phosphate glucuronosyltransferase
VSENARAEQFDFTLLVCTYNRAADLREALQTALAQETGGRFSFEVVVVDNNSTDDTRAVVEEFVAAGHTNLRYIFEGRQGKSYALNTGLAAARGRLYTIVDDDFVLPPDWLANIFEGFRAHPDVSFVSGKVLPLWQAEPPAWLTAEHWSAVAVADYGGEEFFADESKQICLLACTFRLEDVRAVGGYDGQLGVSAGQIGGVEDLDILRRLWAAGRRGLYLPGVWFRHKVAPSRLTKAYHRRWHKGHGRSYALMRDAEVERASARLFDVPSHMYRQAAASALGWLWHTARGRGAQAFACEAQLHFIDGFFRQRRADYIAGGGRGTLGELVSFARALVSGKLLRRT